MVKITNKPQIIDEQFEFAVEALKTLISEYDCYPIRYSPLIGSGYYNFQLSYADFKNVVYKFVGYELR